MENDFPFVKIFFKIICGQLREISTIRCKIKNQLFWSLSNWIGLKNYIKRHKMHDELTNFLQNAGVISLLGNKHKTDEKATINELITNHMP